MPLRHWLVALILSILTIGSEAAIALKYPPLRSTLPGWFNDPELVLDVKWTRIWSTVSEVHDGYCHLFYTDSKESDMFPADQQIAQCALRTAEAVLSKDPATKHIRFHFVNSVDEVGTAWHELFTNAQGWDSSAAGFVYVDPVTHVCTVVANRKMYVLGHEIKHCFDGGWHGDEAYARRRAGVLYNN
jgi:hypothetical protein